MRSPQMKSSSSLISVWNKPNDRRLLCPRSFHEPSMKRPGPATGALLQWARGLECSAIGQLT